MYYRDASWLRTRYICEGKTLREIAKECGVTYNAIQSWLQIHRIRKKKPITSRPSEEELRDLYMRRQLGLRDIGAVFGVTETPVKRWMIEYDIPRRSRITHTTTSREKISRALSGSNSALYRGGQQSVPCQQCGELVTDYPCRLNRAHGIFCRPPAGTHESECYIAWRAENRHLISGQNASAFKGKVTVYCSECGESKEIYPCEAKEGRDYFCPPRLRHCRAKWMTKHKSGRNSPAYGGNPSEGIGRGIGGKYQGTYMRSTWERLVAAWLDRCGIHWQYEPKRFYFDDCSYLPDFYLPDLGIWWEVKGYFSEDAAKKISLFRQSQTEPIVVIDRGMMKFLGLLIKSAHGVAG